MSGTRFAYHETLRVSHTKARAGARRPHRFCSAGKPAAHEPHTMQMPSGLRPARICFTIGLQWPCARGRVGAWSGDSVRSGLHANPHK
jgi:hypothetical protein